MVNRIKPIMEEIIRQIQDNILVTNEAFHHMKLKKKGKRYEMAVKLDMNKAYDWVEWDFLMVVLKKIGFEDKWIWWINECISFVSYNIIVNGKQTGTIFPSRDLRQGDPLPLTCFCLSLMYCLG